MLRGVRRPRAGAAPEETSKSSQQLTSMGTFERRNQENLGKIMENPRNWGMLKNPKTQNSRKKHMKDTQDPKIPFRILRKNWPNKQKETFAERSEVIEVVFGLGLRRWRESKAQRGPRFWEFVYNITTPEVFWGCF